MNTSMASINERFQKNPGPGVKPPVDSLISPMFRYVLYASSIIVAGMCLFFLFKKNESYATDEGTLSKGKKLFTTHCASCHGVEEDGIGPRLGGITRLLSEQALKIFIKNPAKA